jgi:hypothetical protein
VHYTLRYFRSGSSVTPLERWVVSSRIESRRILAENVDK